MDPYNQKNIAKTALDYRLILQIFTILIISAFIFAYVQGAIDVTPPYIMRDFPSSITSNSVLINWTTAEPATGKVEYCLAPAHCGTFSGTINDLSTSHAVYISGLTTGWRYYYWIYSSDAAGNQAVSGGYRTFMTSFYPSTATASPSPAPYSTQQAPSAVIVSTPAPTPTPYSQANYYTQSSYYVPTPVPTPISTPVATPTPPPFPTPIATPKPAVSYYGLSQNIRLEETGSIDESTNQYWWLNSGGYFTVENGIGRTLAGSLDQNDAWRLYYSVDDPVDTAQGACPQNIFRLITKPTWTNYTQEAYFRIDNYDVSSSPNRDMHNGFFFLNRYVDSENLYYVGIRVDGWAVIKKKINGEYFTLAEDPVYQNGTYDRNYHPILVPMGVWIGLRSEIKNNADGTVSLNLYVDKNNNGNWVLATSANDYGFGGPAIDTQGHGGIRTDFMDASFQRYRISGN